MHRVKDPATNLGGVPLRKGATQIVPLALTGQLGQVKAKLHSGGDMGGKRRRGGRSTLVTWTTGRSAHLLMCRPGADTLLFISLPSLQVVEGFSQVSLSLYVGCLIYTLSVLLYGSTV